MPYRVLHILDHSWPLQDGYAVRSQSLITGQLRNGFQPFVLTSPLHQMDEPSARDNPNDFVPVYRTTLNGGVASSSIRRHWPVLREIGVVSLLRKRILEVVREVRPDLLHAHSPALCGLAALQAAKAARLPFVYEIRAFWEDAAVDQEKTTATAARYKASRALETYVARRAPAVVGIATHILNDLKERGIDGARLFHMPNGVDATRFTPPARDHALATTLGVRAGETVFGFIGSLYRYEGVEWLVGAATELRKRRRDFKFVIVGEGEKFAEVKAAVTAHKAQEYVVITGRVPFADVKRYYSIMDVMVYPRRSVRIAELVTPLKPLEAMAQGIAVIGSNIGGIRELIEHERTGLLFPPDDVDAFCAVAERFIASPEERAHFAAAGREHTLREKDWNVLAARYAPIYDFAMGRDARDAAAAAMRAQGQ